MAREVDGGGMMIVTHLPHLPPLAAALVVHINCTARVSARQRSAAHRHWSGKLTLSTGGSSTGSETQPGAAKMWLWAVSLHTEILETNETGGRRLARLAMGDRQWTLAEWT